MRGAVFDFNGTMFFDEDKHVRSWKIFAKEEFDVDLRDEDFQIHVHGKNNADILSFLTGRTLSKEEVLRLATKKELLYQHLCEEDKEHLHLVDGLEDFLSLLKSHGVRLAIATASMKPNVDWYIKTFDLKRFFEEKNIIYDDGDLERGKPDPLIYQIAFSSLGIIASDAVIFEDSLSGLQSAISSGAHLVCEISADEKRVIRIPGISHHLRDFRDIPEDVIDFLLS